ncbi:hypothetical protein D3C78_1934240 [compost metagenome]
MGGNRSTGRRRIMAVGRLATGALIGFRLKDERRGAESLHGRHGKAAENADENGGKDDIAKR